jgi:RNA polymerase sigma-70 factor (sigma-E family)
VSSPDGFDDFVASRSPRLLRTAFLLTHDWATAEDLLQAALARAWEAWRRINGDPEPYVRRIVINLYASAWRRRWRGELPTADPPEGAGADPHAALDDRDRLWRALRRLPRRQRAVIVLRFFEDLPDAEIADILGCTLGTVRSQASRALGKLRLDESLIQEETLR